MFVLRVNSGNLNQLYYHHWIDQYINETGIYNKDDIPKIIVWCKSYSFFTQHFFFFKMSANCQEVIFGKKAFQAFAPSLEYLVSSCFMALQGKNWLLRYENCIKPY